MYYWIDVYMYVCVHYTGQPQSITAIKSNTKSHPLVLL